MIPVQPQAEGNPEVIKLFEQALTMAREGRLICAALVAVENKGSALRAMAGVPGKELEVFFGLERLKDHIKGQIAEYEQRPQQTRDSADFVCWSLRDQPFSYDFLCALIAAEMARVREGAPAPLKFCFHGAPMRPTDYSSMFYNNVMVPLLPMIGAQIDPRALNGRTLGGHNIDAIVAASRRGETVPRLQCDPHALNNAKQNYGNAVTITLREAEHWPHRNSNLTEWLKLAEAIEHSGERVVFVRDTAKAAEPIAGFETHPIAATNLEARLALYEAAKCNLFTPTGPYGLALFGSRPWICFQHSAEDDLYEPNRPSWWKKYYGMSPGQQWPWSLSSQRLVWAKDDFPTMIAAWSDLHESLKLVA